MVKSPWKGYAVALCFSAIAVVLFYTLLDVRTPFMVCLAAVLLSGWIGGPRPALFSAVIGAIATSYLFYTIAKPETPGEIWGFLTRELLFVAVSALAVLISSAERKAESKALSQKDLLEFALSHSVNGVIVADEKGRVVFMNPRAHRLTGYGAEAIGLAASEVFKIAELESFKELENPIQRALREGVPARLPNPVLLLSKDGRRYVIEDSASAFSAPSNAPRNIVLMFRDVTEQRRVEAELRSNAERFRLALEAGRLSTWEWNIPTGDIDCEELQFLLPPGTKGMIADYLNAIHTDDRAAVHRALEQSLEEHKDFACEYRFVLSNSQIVWRLSLARPFYDEKGQAVRMLGISRDITEQKLVEQSVREGQAQFRSVAETASDGFVTIDERGKIVYANGAAATLFGYARAELIGQPITNIMPDRFQPLHSDAFAKYQQAEKRNFDWRRVEFVARHRDGSELPVEVSLSEAYAGKRRLFSAIVRDISERKRAEELVQAAQARLLLAQRIAGVGTYEWDLLSGEAAMSPESEAMYGLKPGEFKGTREHWLSLVHPDDAPHIEAAIKAQLDSGTDDYSSEYRVVWPDGSVRWLVTRGKLFRDETSRPVRMLGAEQDITRQKKAEAEREKLLASERLARERLELAQRASRIGTYERNIKTGDMTMSPELESLVGLRPGEFSGRYEDWQKFIFPLDQPQVTKDINDAAARLGEYYVEFRVVRDDGGVRWLASSGKIIGDEAGDPQKSVGACHDITQRKSMEVERERILEREMSARAEAERASRLKDEFLATVSHELRTPLTAILGWSKMLLEDSLDPEAAKRGMESIDRNARAQAQLVEDLLDVSRIISGKLRVHLKPMDLADVVKSAVESIRPTALAKKLEIEVDLPTARVSGDADRLQQVAFNILFNAVKFSFRLGRIVIKFESSGHMARFTVRDYGKGIEPSFIPNLFQRFTQEDMGSTRRHGGMGLGLAIVRHIIELHGGFVKADSEGEGKGATITVDLPLLRQGDSGIFMRQDTRPSNARIPKIFANLDGVAVLCVEDDADTRGMIAAALRLAGTKVFEAENAEHAHEIFKRERPQVILCDITLPGEDGMSFVRRIRSLPDSLGGDTPAIALTAHSRGQESAILSAGFQECLGKPVNPADVLEAISNALKKRHAVAAKS